MGLIYSYFTRRRVYTYSLIWMFLVLVTMLSFIFFSPVFAMVYSVSLIGAMFLEFWLLNNNKKWHVYNRVMPVKASIVVLSHYLCFLLMMFFGMVVILAFVAIGSFFVETFRYVPVAFFTVGMCMTFVSFFIPVRMAVLKSDTTRGFHALAWLLVLSTPFIQMFLVLGNRRVTVLLATRPNPLYEIFTYAARPPVLWVYMAISLTLFIFSIVISTDLYKKIDA